MAARWTGWRPGLLALLLGMVALLSAGPGWAQAADAGTTPQAVPALSGRVIDRTATLSEAQRQALDAKLADFEARSGPQIVVLMVPTTAPEDIAAYANRVADTWKIGRREVGDGLLLLVAKNDRAVRIEVARALEGAVPDLAARQIIDQAVVPAFRQGDFAGGLNQAVDRLMARISGEGLPAPVARGTATVPGLGALPQDLPRWSWALLAIPVAIVALRALLGPGLAATLMGGAGVVGGWWLLGTLTMGLVAGFVLALVTALGLGDALRLVLSSAGRGGFGGGGGGGGGGFSSGGGGSFGGGGASGRW